MTAACPVCQAPVLEAQDPAGAVVRLRPRLSPTGNLAARMDRDGEWHARLLRPGETLRNGEERHRAHSCAGQGGGLAELRTARSRAAHTARARRGRPATKTPYGNATGVRVPPPGGDAA